MKGFISVWVVILLVVGLAGGVYYFGKSQAPKPQFQNPVVVSQTPQASPDKTANPDSIGANWKTYTNEKWGITFKYPDNWIVNDTLERIHIIPSGNKDNKTFIAINSWNNPKNLSLQDLEKEYTGLSMMSPGLYVKNIKQVTINGYAGYYFDTCVLDGPKPQKCERYIIPRKNVVFTIDNFVWDKRIEQQKGFDKILSTFKFTQ